MHRFTALPSPDGSSASDSTAQNAALRRWTRELLGLPEEVVVTLHEAACADPGCPLLETRIVVFGPGATRTWALTRPKVAVTKLMLQQTLQTPPQVS